MFAAPPFSVEEMHWGVPASFLCAKGLAGSCGKRSKGADCFQEQELRLATERNIEDGQAERGGASGGLRALGGLGALARLGKDVPIGEQMSVGPWLSRAFGERCAGR